MKKTLMLLLLALLSGAGVLWLVARGSGYVLVNYGGYQLEMSFWTALLSLLLLILLLRWGVAVVAWLLRAGGVVQWWRQRRQRSAMSRREQGLTALACGDWPEAKRLLVGASGQPLLESDRLLAARALHGCGEQQQALALLAPALEQRQRGALLLAAQLSEKPQQLIAWLEPLAQAKKLPAEPLQRLCAALLAAGKAAAALELLPQLNNAAAEPLYRRWWAVQSTALDDAKQLQRSWRSVPPALREQPAWIADYARRLVAVDEPIEAEKLLLKSLQSQLKRSQRHFDRDCLAALTTLPESGLNKRLRALESLLQQQPDSQLAYTVARLCQQGQLWGRARDFANQALALESSPAVHKLLAEIHLQLGDSAAAGEHFRRGLELALSR
jgi:HemY protein